MKKIKLFTIVLIVLAGAAFPFKGINAFAKTTTHKAASSSSAAKYAMSKAKIKSLQTSLKLLGYFKFKVDGVLGTNTKNAIKRFQRANGLSADGIAGTKTMTKINQRINAKSRKSRLHSSRGSTGSVMSVINFAKRYLGVDYNFGSASPDEFDCSGFTMFVFKAVGLNLPHSAAEQANLGHAVSRNDLEPGDLVFFHTYKPGISHVGIYLGNGSFIHASSGAGHVTITSLSEAYYSERFRGGTRLLGD